MWLQSRTRSWAGTKVEGLPQHGQLRRHSGSVPHPAAVFVWLEVGDSAILSDMSHLRIMESYQTHGLVYEHDDIKSIWTVAHVARAKWNDSYVDLHMGQLRSSWRNHPFSTMGSCAAVKRVVHTIR